MSVKKRIIICGYPKSGNTWLTRLTAEVVGCPVAGFWNDPENQDLAIEGEERISDFECYKAHQNINQLKKSLTKIGNGTEKILYIIRDPRDIVLSAHHFYYRHIPIPYPGIKKWMWRLHLKRLYNLIFNIRGKRMDYLINAILEGDEHLWWLGTPWDEHVQGYRETGMDICIVTYEELLSNPESVVNRILNYLDLERTGEQIEQAIHNQSFSVKKASFQKAGKGRKAWFMRKGRSGTWKKELSREQVVTLEENLAPVMHNVGYKCRFG